MTYKDDFSTLTGGGTSPHSGGMASPYSSGMPSPPTVVSDFNRHIDTVKADEPHLVVVEQPQSKFRFRYKSEMVGTHGQLKAERADRNKAIFPTVKLANWREGTALIRLALYTGEDNFNQRRRHVHELSGKNCDKDTGMCEMVLDHNTDYVASFQNLGIIHIAKRDVKDIIIQRKKAELIDHACKRQPHRTLEEIRQSITPTDIKKFDEEAEEIYKTMDLNKVVLRFQAFHFDNALNCYRPLTRPVDSELVVNLKNASTGELKIVRMSEVSAPCTGGTEVWMLVEKVKKSNIKIKFYELDSEFKEVWSAYGTFSEADVHHQYAIIFKTPPYRITNLRSSVRVKVQLERPNDKDISEPRDFTYYPDNRKRQSSFMENIKLEEDEDYPYKRGGRNKRIRQGSTEPLDLTNTMGAGNCPIDGIPDMFDVLCGGIKLSDGSNNSPDSNSASLLSGHQSPEYIVPSPHHPAASPHSNSSFYPNPDQNGAMGTGENNYFQVSGGDQVPQIQVMVGDSQPYLIPSPSLASDPSHKYQLSTSPLNQIPSPNQVSPSYGQAPSPQLGSYQQAPSPVYQQANSPSYQQANTTSYQQANSPSYQQVNSPSYQQVNSPGSQHVNSPSYQQVNSPGSQHVNSPSYQQVNSPGSQHVNSPSYQQVNSPGSQHANSPSYSQGGISPTQMRAGNDQMVPIFSHQANPSDTLISGRTDDSQQRMGQQGALQQMPVMQQQQMQQRQHLQMHNNQVPSLNTPTIQVQESSYETSNNDYEWTFNNMTEDAEHSLGGANPNLEAIDIEGSMDFININDLIGVSDVRTDGLKKDAKKSAPLATDSVPQKPCQKKPSPADLDDITRSLASVKLQPDTLKMGANKTMPPPVQQKVVPGSVDVAFLVAISAAESLQAYAATGDMGRLLATHRYLLAVQNNQGDNALHTAVSNKNWEAFIKILTAAVNLRPHELLNTQNFAGESPLHLAVRAGEVAMADRLAGCPGSDISLTDRAGNTPLHLAAALPAGNAATAIIARLLKKPVNGARSKVESALQAYNYQGETALHVAVCHNNFSAVKQMVTAGTEVHLCERKRGANCLHLAAQYHCTEIAQYLIKHTTMTVNSRMFDGNTALHIAAQEGDAVMCAILMAAGADPRAKNSLKLQKRKKSESEDDDSSEDEEEEEEEDIESDEEEPDCYTPIDYASQNEEVLRVLNGADPSKASKEQDSTDNMDSGIVI